MRRMPQSSSGLTREQGKDFKKAYMSIMRASNVFRYDEIWPTQCDQILDNMQHMNRLVKDFSNLLDVDSDFSRAIDPLRFELLIILCSIEKLINNDLIPLIMTFRSMCRISSPQAIRQKRRILYKVDI